jgi:methionine-rich copper-binding protein CopC
VALWRVALVIPALVVATACAPRIPAPARLVYADPAPDAVIGAVPDTLRLDFSEDLALGESSASVLDPTGQLLAATTELEPGDPRVLHVQLSHHGGTGQFTVSWQTLSAQTRTPTSGTFTFTVEPGAPAQPRITAAPAVVDVQQQLTVDGSGFHSGAPVILTVGDDEEPLGTAQADASGQFSLMVAVPSDVPFGDQPISAADDRGTKAATDVQVKWGGWPPLRVYTLAVPGPRPGQVTLTVVGRNRSDYVLDGVEVRLEVPSGAAVVSASDGAQVQDGTVTWNQGLLDRTSLIPRQAVLAVGRAVVGRAWINFRHRRASGCIGDQCLPAFVDETYSESGPVTPAPD